MLLLFKLLVMMLLLLLLMERDDVIDDEGWLNGGSSENEAEQLALLDNEVLSVRGLSPNTRSNIFSGMSWLTGVESSTSAAMDDDLCDTGGVSSTNVHPGGRLSPGFK